ncbi:MAG: PAS domain S-box protein [Bacteroidales bacterium]|nr:MAG: PAS domain S-box protein [Bacteroidales bacterium]
MVGKREWVNIQSIIEYLIIAFIYILAAVTTSFAVKDISLPFFHAISTGLMAGIVITRGSKSILGFLIGATLWQIITISTSIAPLPLSLVNSLLFIISEGVTLFIIAKSFQSISNILSLIEQNNGIRQFFVTTLLAAIPQAIILTSIFYKTNEISSSLSFIKLLNLLWLSITVSILSFAPIFIAFANNVKIINGQSVKPSWELIFFLLLLIVPNTLEILNITTPLYSFPIHYLVFPAIFIIAFRRSSKTLAFSILVFYLVTIYAASTNHGLFFSSNKFQNASNIYYFILFVLFISLIIRVAVNEKRVAFESLKKTFNATEDEVARQISIFRELNSKLFEEIENKGLIERELSESRDLLEESQDIASITSWQLNIKTNEIIWSKSAHKLFGLDNETPPSNLSDYKKLIHPNDLAYAESIIGRALKSPINFEAELRHLLPDSNINYVLIRGKSFEEKGEMVKIIGLSLDITKKKEIEVRLTENEEKYRALFESNINAVSLIDPNGKIFIDLNQAFEQKYGYKKSELVGQPYSLITSEIDDTYSAIDNAYRNGSHRVQSRIHKRKNGEEFYVEGYFVKFMSSGKPLIFSISQDITQRKNAEKILAERELQYRLFFESDLIGMAEATTQKEWITFNNKLCLILGYTAKELIKKTWDSLTHPEDLKMEMKLYNDIIVRKNSAYSIEKRFIRSDGSYIYCKVAVKAILNPQGNISHLVKLIEDISTRKQIERDLLESRATLRRAQQIAKLGSWSWNPTLQMISLNDEAYQLLGWKRSQGPFSIKSFIELVTPEKREVVENLINEARKGQKAMESIEIPILVSNEITRYILLNVGYNFGSSVAVSEVVATMADITEVKKAEMALKEANALKDQIFSIIAHDLRGPIGTINQMIAFIVNDPDSIDNKTRNDLMLSIKDTTEETYSLLENLLDWAKDQRQIAFNPETIHIYATINTTIALLSGMASPKNITITNSIDNTITVFADPYMINTVFRNLLSNAIKFTPKNGNISIQASRIDSIVTIKFIDSGVGIPKNMIEKIFDSSNNYSTPGTNNEKGTGLGLKLVNRLITKNNGTISVESEPNKGTTFTVTLSVKP